MYDRILFPTDGSEAASSVFEFVLDLADHHDATVHVLNVADTTVDSVTRVGGDVVDALEAEGERTVEAAADRAAERGVPVVTDVLQGGPHETILDYADEYGADLIVMPTHGREGLERLLLGSVTERVLRRSDAPVLTVQPEVDLDEHYPFGRVLVPVDGSSPAEAALAIGVETATAHGAALDVLSVAELTAMAIDGYPDMQLDALEAQAREVVEEAVATAEDAGVERVSGTTGLGPSVHGEILAYIDEHDVDLVVIGTHGRTGFDRYLLGSIAEKLVRTAPVPVITVRPSEGEEEGDADAAEAADP